MTKPIHPIRKLRRAVSRHDFDQQYQDRIIARHVKPLLDALEAMPSIAMGCTGPGNTLDQAQGYSDACRDIAAKIRQSIDPLLAAWRATL